MSKEQEIEELKHQISELRIEVSRLENELWMEKFNNKDYVTDLSKYKGKELVDIRAFGSNGMEVYIPSGGFLEVESDGKLYASSHQGDEVVQWDTSINNYILCLRHYVVELNIVGFTDIVVD